MTLDTGWGQIDTPAGPAVLEWTRGGVSAIRYMQDPPEVGRSDEHARALFAAA